MLAVGYTRVSTTEQEEDGFSLDSQDHSIRAFAEGRDLTVTRIYQDAGISGTRSDRPALEELLRDAERGEFEVVIVHSIDRFYRNLQGLLRTLNQLQQQGVAFISISENIDFTRAWGKLALAVLGTLAEIYIDRLSEDTQRGKKQRARNGLWNGSSPLGYCRGNCYTCASPNGPGYCPNAGQGDLSRDKGLVLHPIESEAVKLAFEWYVTGSYSDGKIASMLNDYAYALPPASGDGGSVTVRFRSKGRPGRSRPKPLSKDSIREVLQNPFYTGVVPYYGPGKRRKEPVSLSPGQHEPLVSQETFDRCQQIRRLNSTRPRTNGTTRSRVYPLSGVIRCANCGSKMRAQTISSAKAPYYVCAGRVQHTTNCREPAAPATAVEEQLVEYLDSLPFPEDWQHWVCQQLNPQWDEEEIERKAQALDERLSRAVELYLAGDITKARYEAEKRECEDQSTDLRPKAIRDTLARVEHLVDFGDRWKRSSALEKRGLIRSSLVSAQVREQQLVAIEPSPLLYPVLRNLTTAHGFNSGSDG